MKVNQLLDLLDKAAALLEGGGPSERAEGLRAFAKAIQPLHAHSLEALLDVLAQATLDTNPR
jgi:hypothetical protein